MKEGLFVITGCGHSGIVNTLEHAKKVSGQERILGIMGGFHLKEVDTQTTETVNYLRKNKVKHIIPSHCTELPALSAFYEAFRIKQVRTSDVMNF
jgi:7,8-dihydropterin-6-yl-methyl-4-(beta-D-ribofuranosyl)aminobenzene 5'-phosphate synthase